MSLKVIAVGATNFLLVFYTGAYLSRHLQIIFLEIMQLSTRPAVVY